MLLFVNNLIVIALGFGAGVLWLGFKDKKKFDELSWDTVSADEYNELVEDHAELSYTFYAIDLKREEYASKNHTIYRKVARQLDAILYPVTSASHND